MPDTSALAEQDRLALEAELAELVAILMDSNDSTSGLALSTLQTYAERIGRFSQQVQAYGLKGLNQVCQALQQRLMSYRGSLIQGSSIDVDVRELLEEWPILVMGYLADPADEQYIDSLLDSLQTPAWGESLAEDVLHDIRQAFAETEIDLSLSLETLPQQTTDAVFAADDDQADFIDTASSEEALFTSASDDQADLLPELALTEQAASADQNGPLQAGIAGLLDILAPALEDTSPATLNPILSRFAEQLQLIGADAAATDVIGFYDLCLLFAEQLHQISEREDDCTPDELALLEEWPTLAMLYLENPQESANAEALLEHMGNAAWRTPLAEQETQILRDLLCQTQQPIISEHLGEDASPRADDAVIVSVPETSPKVSPDLPLDLSELGPKSAAPNLAAEASTSDESAVTISEDLLDILRAELAEIAETGAQSLAIVQEPNSSDIQRQQALEEYTEELQRLSLASDSIGLQGLAQLCAQLHANLDAFTTRSQALSPAEHSLLSNWQQPVLDYLETIGASQASQNLIAFMQQSDWLLPLDENTADELLQALRNPAPTLEDFGEVAARPSTARPEDVSLALPPDTNQELLDSLLQELPHQTSDFTATIQRLYDGQGTMADMESAQRIAHTLKGAGNTVGVVGIANITHHIEDILIALGKEHSMPTGKLAGTLMDAADCLETMSESLLGLSEPPQQAQAVLQAVLDLANRIDHEGVPSVVAGDSVSKPADPAALELAKQTSPTVATSQEEATAVPMVRVPAPLIDELLRLAGENIILTGQIQERIRANMTQAQLIREQNQTLQQLVNELEQLVDVQGVGMPVLSGGAGGLDNHFDPLEMDQYNELHTVTRRLAEAAADASALDEGISDNFTELETLISDQTQVHRDNQEAIMHTRMVPIQTVVPRLQRTVRQTGRLTDKEVELNVKGSNTLIDSNVLSDMIDSLMHVLRNAIDHGIETADIRQVRQKPAAGRITLSFQREGSSIVVRCQDDGNGLNLDNIRTTAEQRGLILPGQALSADELTRLILQPGFSTRTQTTQVSGRGIGLDAVYSEVLKLKGSLAIHSEAGVGCTIEMRLPVTLISAHALLVRCNQDLFAIAERGIEQLVHATTGQVLKTDTGLVYQLEGRQFDIIQLESLLGLPISDDETALMQRPALLARDETGTIKAIMVEEMVDSRDLVVKPMGHFAPTVKGILGATILGDGSITPVLDMPELLRDVAVSNLMVSPVTTDIDRPAPPPTQAKVLVVDDSLSVRRTMQQLISDAGFEVLTARDGLEAVSVLNSDLPSIMLVDLEMPRMNGLELTQHARAQAATRDLPIVMMTSRSTTKHRQEAEAAGVSAYLTKPVADDELIGYLNQMIAA